MDREELVRISEDSSPDLEYLRSIQEEVAEKVVLQDEFDTIEYLGGFDSAYMGDTVVTACIILKYGSFKVIEEKSIVSKVRFPYISGYFVFREGPAILELLSEMITLPTILMINSHGIAHPCFAGCASHIGVIVNLPTIGVAQNILCGTTESEPSHIGEWVPLYYQNKIVGASFLSQEKNKPIIISPGHLITLESAIEIVKKSLKSHKFPDPIYLAHELARKIIREI